MVRMSTGNERRVRGVKGIDIAFEFSPNPLLKEWQSALDVVLRLTCSQMIQTLSDKRQKHQEKPGLLSTVFS